MVSQKIDQLLRQVMALTVPEREQFLEMLRAQSEEDPSRPPAGELAAELANRGITLTVPPNPTPEEIARFKSWRPIEMPGGPLSDDIIRNRR